MSTRGLLSLLESDKGMRWSQSVVLDGLGTKLEDICSNLAGRLSSRVIANWPLLATSIFPVETPRPAGITPLTEPRIDLMIDSTFLLRFRSLCFIDYQNLYNNLILSQSCFPSATSSSYKLLVLFDALRH